MDYPKMRGFELLESFERNSVGSNLELNAEDYGVVFLFDIAVAAGECLRKVRILNGDKINSPSQLTIECAGRGYVRFEEGLAFLPSQEPANFL